MAYDEQQHINIFAAWAASTAASASPKCRFKVEVGMQVLDKIHIKKYISGVDKLPEPDEFDALHRQLRIDALTASGSLEGFSHGVAAKLINVYFKTIFMNKDVLSNPKVKAIHPPIDRLLLKELADRAEGDERKKWRMWENKGWSNFSSNQYEEVIQFVKSKLGEEKGLWEIEKFWKGCNK